MTGLAVAGRPGGQGCSTPGPALGREIPHSYIGWGKTTHLGYGIPLLIGAKLARPETFCLNFMGDGAFGMSGLDIETAGRIGAPITTVLLNNGDMATYRAAIRWRARSSP